MNLFSVATNGRSKVINKASRKLVKAMKKHIKQEALKGRLNSNFNILEADIYGLAEGMADEVYEKACDMLNKYYKNQVTIEIEMYGCGLSHKRLKAVINKI